MKILENRATAITNGDKIVKYKDLLIMAINTPPPGGFKADSSAKAEIIKKLLEKEKNGKFEFDNNLLEDLKTAVENTGWPFSHVDLVKFLKYMKGL